VTSGAGERVNGDQRVAVESGVWSSSSISSSSEERERLEVIWTPAVRVVDDSIIVLQSWTNQKCHNVRLRERERIGGRRRRRFHREVPESAVVTCRYAGLRREISESLLRLGRRSKRGEGEEVEAFYRRGGGAELLTE
jgi:hypothetical protein